MAEVPAFKRITDDMKNNTIPQVCLLFGEEDYLIDWATNCIISSLIDENFKVFDFVKFDSGNISIKDLELACETLPISSKKRVVLITGELNSDMESYIKSIPDSCILLIKSLSIKKNSVTYKYAKKIGGAYEFTKLERGLLVDFLKKEFKSQQKKAEISAINLLIDISGYLNKDSVYGLYDFKNDVKKLCDYANLDIINTSHITEVITPSLEDSIFDMIESAVSGKSKAFDLLFAILQKKNQEFMLMATLVSHFDLMLMSKELLEKGYNHSDIANTLNIHPFRAKKLYLSARNIDLSKIRALLKSALLMESKVKSGELDSVLALSTFLLKNKLN